MPYHVNPRGNASPCKASKNACPFGGEQDHYATKEDARTAYEQKMQSGTFTPAQPLTFEQRKENLQADFVQMFPAVKIYTRTAGDPQVGKSLGLRSTQEILFEVRGKGKYDQDFWQAHKDMVSWAENNNLKIIKNLNMLAPLPKNSSLHFGINKPTPTREEKLASKREAMAKLQQEVERLERG